MRLSVNGSVLDAEFDVVETDSMGSLALILESRGGSLRNPDYLTLLQHLLQRLCDFGATITTIEVISQRVRHLSSAERRLPFPYPLRLNPVTDVADLKNRIGDLQRRIGSKATTSGGGNRTRRIQIKFSIPGMTRTDFVNSLANPSEQNQETSRTVRPSSSNMRI